MTLEAGKEGARAALEALPKEEAIHLGEGSITAAPLRGGIISSLKLAGHELLYMNRETYADPAKNVRGGIPIMFPNAGAVDDPKFDLKQHGFARTSEWAYAASADGRSFSEVLTAPAIPGYPHESTLTLEAALLEDGTARITQTALNRGGEPMPVAMGLHPYFAIPAGRKGEILFDFPGGEVIEAEASVWMEGGTTSIDNPGVPLQIRIPGAGVLTLTVSPEFKKVWVWSLPGEDFVCIEPVMRDVNGLSTDPELVGPGGSVAGTLLIQFAPEG